MPKSRCKAVCITINSGLVCARRDHQHPPHWERFANRELFSTEHDIDTQTDMITFIPSTIDNNKPFWASKSNLSLDQIE